MKRLVKPLLADDQYILRRPVRLRGMLQAWNEEDTESTFKIKGFAKDGVIICTDNDHTWYSTVTWDRIPIEDLIRLENLVQRRHDRGFDAPFKVPKLEIVASPEQQQIRALSYHSDSPSGWEANAL